MDQDTDKIATLAAGETDRQQRRHWRETPASEAPAEGGESAMSSPSMSAGPLAEASASPVIAVPTTAETLPDQPDFRPGLRQMLRRYALGWYPCYLGESNGGPVGWRKYSHRGVQWLDDRIHIGKKQKRDVFDERFVVRHDTAFAAVVEGCADPSTHGGATWVTPGLKKVYAELHRLGYAHSFECWQGEQLVGGSFGIQLGEMMTVESMFHTADNASKAAYVRALLMLRDRGFKLVDINHVTPFFERFGGETLRQWEFEQILKSSLKRWPSMGEGQAAAPWPAGVLGEVATCRILDAAERRLRDAANVVRRIGTAHDAR